MAKQSRYFKLASKLIDGKSDNAELSSGSIKVTMSRDSENSNLSLVFYHEGNQTVNYNLIDGVGTIEYIKPEGKGVYQQRITAIRHAVKNLGLPIDKKSLVDKMSMGGAIVGAVIGSLATVAILKNEERKHKKSKDKNKGFRFEEGGSVAKEIYQQLGGNRFAMMTGAKNFVSDSKNNALSFRIGRNGSKANYVKIRLNSMDTYDVTFGRIHNMDYRDLETMKGVYAEDLQKVFTEYTGLYTSFKEGGEVLYSDSGTPYSFITYKDVNSGIQYEKKFEEKSAEESLVKAEKFAQSLPEGTSMTIWYPQNMYAVGGKTRRDMRKYKKGGTIESDTMLLPIVIAESIAQERVVLKYKKELDNWENLSKEEKDALNKKIEAETNKLAGELSKKAEGLYKNNADFKKKVNAQGNKGRDYLYTFMNHWADAYSKGLEIKFAEGGHLADVGGVSVAEVVISKPIMLKNGGGVDEANGKYQEWEIIVVSKDSNKDTGKHHKDRFLVSARSLDEAKKIATDLWNETFSDFDSSIVKVIEGGKVSVLLPNPSYKYQNIVKRWLDDNGSDSLKYKLAVALLEGEKYPNEKLEIKDAQYDRLLRSLEKSGGESPHEMAWRTENYSTYEAEGWAKEALNKFFVLKSKETYAKGGVAGNTNSENYSKFGVDNSRLSNYDINELDALELIEYERLKKSGYSKPDILQFIINSVEGDYSKLSKTLAEIAEEQYPSDEYFEDSKQYAKGGDVGNENALMVMNDNKQIKHHTQELNDVVEPNTKVPAWVVSKVHRSASDLSDATHYLDGVNSKYADGGKTEINNKEFLITVPKGKEYLLKEENHYDLESLIEKSLTKKWFGYGSFSVTGLKVISPNICSLSIKVPKGKEYLLSDEYDYEFTSLIESKLTSKWHGNGRFDVRSIDNSKDKLAKGGATNTKPYRISKKDKQSFDFDNEQEAIDAFDDASEFEEGLVFQGLDDNGDYQEIDYAVFCGEFKKGGAIKRADFFRENKNSDAKRLAKPTGYRFRGNNYEKPTKEQIAKGLKSGKVYFEDRAERSDMKNTAKMMLECGGEIMKNGGSISRGDVFYDIDGIEYKIQNKAKEGWIGINEKGEKVNMGNLSDYTRMTRSFHEEDEFAYGEGGGASKFIKTQFNSHENHNPDYDILEGHLDNDSFITYAVKVKGSDIGKESMEYYSGENYVVGSKKKSSSRNYSNVDSIPKKYKSQWLILKKMYETKSYAGGGKIKDQYKNTTARQVWTDWTPEQREHFLLDHSELLDNDRIENNLGGGRTVQKNKVYSELTPHTKRVLEAHVSHGQYAKGGGVFTTYEVYHTPSQSIITFDKKTDVVKNIREWNGSPKKEITIDGLLYRKNKVYNTFNSVEKNEILTKQLIEKKYSFSKGGSTEVISESGHYLTISATKDLMKIKLTDDGKEEVKDLRADGKSDSDIMSMLFEDIQGNSELIWQYDLGETGFGLTSASGVTDGYYYGDNGEFTDEGRKDSRLYYFADYMLRSEVDDLLNKGELVLNGAENSFAKGGGVGQAEMREVEGYDIDEVLTHFIIAGLWASTDDDDESLDYNYSIEDVDDKSKEDIKKGIEKFINQNKAILKKHNISDESLGHDLFLTSQGHGAGFWDRGYGQDGDILSENSEKIFASDPPYVGDDNKIYFSTVKFSSGGKIKRADFFRDDKNSDSKRLAKPTGFRFKGNRAKDYEKPTAEQVRRGLKSGRVYHEDRAERSDMNNKAKSMLKDGGRIGDEISIKDLTEALGHEPNYPYQTYEGCVLTKCMWRQYYKVVHKTQK